MRFLIVALGAIAVAFAVSLILGRRGIYVATVALLIGAGIALLSVFITSCSQCWTSALPVGAFFSAPFYIVGWIALAQAEMVESRRSLLYGLCGIMVVQVLWASRVILFATVDGRCPCGAGLFGLVSTELSAVGFDRWAGPWFLAEAIVTLAILIAALRRRPELPTA
ncbi:hypothetical protein [Chelatococcus asaccharovorans]|uniref:hypothetical protein n=1 Tax=Chelatococcus asaccharovorans TaxID=28210 RepID=UPI00224C6F3D|nr:hypothetical protein [Chelatococcus asaccharovorans]CAH1668476.1 conserved membrane hypothetical protein [Chelatococcus asaccharovorans]CAH1680084.1 conserved membrane hypothetical protein [Chelatococcus asaccharovorans]